MRKITALLMFATFSISSLSQTKTVFITNDTKIVPEGKKWKLEIGKSTKIQVNSGTLTTGTYCNAMFLSNPRVIWNINKGNRYHAESFGIKFENLEEVPFTNGYTFNIIPILFIDVQKEAIGSKKLVFMAGESVFIGSCLEAIEFIEVNMTPEEIMLQKKERTLALEKEKTVKKEIITPVKNSYAEEINKLTNPELTKMIFPKEMYVNDSTFIMKRGNDMYHLRFIDKLPFINNNYEEVVMMLASYKIVNDVESNQPILDILVTDFLNEDDNRYVTRGVIRQNCNTKDLIYNVKYIFGEACIAVGNINDLNDDGKIIQRGYTLTKKFYNSTYSTTINKATIANKFSKKENTNSNSIEDKEMDFAKPTLQFFNGTKKFCDSSELWYYTVSINANKIIINSYPGKMNTSYKNKNKVIETIVGIIKDGVIVTKNPSEYLTNRFKYENGILYEINNEGGTNDYKECLMN
jgi:hypothetical protein